MQTSASLQWNIQQNNESVMIQLIGELNRNTLLPLWKQRASFLSPRPNQHLYWDLKRLDNLDSAGFSLLTELLNHYQKQNSICIINPPDILKKLAELFDLSEWLNHFLYCEYCENKK